MDILKILLLEDSENDVEFIKEEITSNLNYKFIFKWVITKQEFTSELINFHPDIILSDYNLPQFNGLDALKIALKYNDLIPFIIVTGTLAEEVAADSIKEGAWDYVVKERLHRLPRAIENVLKLKTERLKVRKAEHELNLIRKKSGLQLKILYDAIERAPSSFVITDKNGIIQYVNPKFEEASGYSKEEAVGENPRILKSGFHDGKFYKNLWKTILEGKEYRGEIINKRKNGDLYWEMVSISAIKNNNKEIEYFVAVKRDITESKKIEEELKASEEKFRLITTSAQDAIIMINHEGKTVYWNPAATKTFGYQENEILGKNLHHIIAPPDFHEKHKRAFKLFQKKGIGHFLDRTIELAAIKKNGNRFPVELSLAGMDIDGRKGAVGIIRDITERKKVEKELIKAKEKAEESDRLKSTFLATMSHELRTPLNAIIGFSDLIPDQESKEKMINMSKIVYNSGNHLLKIIEDIFEISMLQTKESEIVKEKFNISDLFSLLEQYASIELSKRGKSSLQLKFQISTEPLFIYSDKRKIKQLLINLISNAIEYTNEGSIQIGYLKEGNGVTLFVKDTGIGISEEKSKIIFDLFRQVDESHTRIHGGVGLGLSICKEISEMLDGNLWVESIIGKGSTFYFSLTDVIADSNISGKLSLKKGKVIKLETRTILVVEDIESNYLLIKGYLANTRAKIIHAKNGLDSISICRNNPNIDLVLMDIHMPGIDGYQATRKIKEFLPDIKIIAQTAFAMPEDRKLALEAGCDDYIAKPFNKNKLFEIISKYLRNI